MIPCELYLYKVIEFHGVDNKYQFDFNMVEY